MAGAVEWTVTAFLDGLVGLFLGLLLIPVAKFAIDPVLGLFRKSDVAKVG